MSHNIFKSLLLSACLATGLSASAEFQAVKVDLTGGNMLTEDEIAAKQSTSFGVKMDADGNPVRVSSDDPTASIIITGAYNEAQHGLIWFTAKANVDGPVKVTIGNCQFNGNPVKIKDAAGTVVNSFDAKDGCWSKADPTAHVSSGFYKGQAGAISVDGGGYTPYIEMRPAEQSELVDEYDITFSLGESGAESCALPGNLRVESGKTFTVPANWTVYAEGKTLTGWTDGTNNYEKGEVVTVSGPMTLTPLFVDNTVSLADRTEAVTIRWDFQRQNGAPTVGFQGAGNGVGFWVAQAQIGTEVIDVKLPFDATSGKINNGNWNDWCQMNGGTKFDVPACDGATISLESYSPTTTTTVDGQAIGNGSTNTPSFTCAGKIEKAELVIGDGSYFRWIQTVLPVVQASAGGSVFEDSDVSVTWPFSDLDNFLTTATVAPAEAQTGVTMIAADKGDANATGTGTSTMSPGVTFVKLKPAVGADDRVTWQFKPAKGLTFTPTAIEADIVRFGTDSKSGVKIYAQAGTGEEIHLGTYTAPRNNKDQAGDKYGSEADYTPHISISLTPEQQTALTTSEIFNLYGTIGVGNAKEGGYANVKVSGKLNGTTEEVATYTLTLTSATPEAGEVSVYPNAESYEAGSKLKVSATENFSYHFQKWTDENGATVSEANPYEFEINANTTLTANYTKNEIYPLNLVIEGGANVNQVLYAPEGNVVDGVHWYEAGEDVKLTTVNNRILTFTNWEDNTTAPERTVRMDGEQNVTANFSATDYIVGWDFYFDQPNSERAADYKAESDNAGLLSLRNAAGQTSTWLTRGVSNGDENGKWGARVWRPRADGYYFEASFSTKGYHNVVLSASLGVSFNTRSVNNVEYSVDGENFTKFGTYNLKVGWTNEEFALPVEAEDQTRIWIRFMPDNDSPLVGSDTDYDGLCISELFILGEPELVNDTEAPKVVSIIPADGSEGASATGSIIVTFDEKIKAGTGDATLGEFTLTPTISGKSAVYSYQGLDYNTAYTFNMPAGAVTDRSGNPSPAVSTSFKTMERVQPDARLFDAIVAQDGSGDYTTLQAAIDNAPADRVKPWLIFVKNGQYKEHIDIPANKPMLHIIGQDRDKAVVLDDKLCGGDNALHVSVGATVVIKSNDCFFENITLENSWGHEREAGPQALALNTVGDRTIFNNVAMLSYQDTWITPSTSNYRAYVRNSLIEGAVDFIYNSGNIYIDNTTLLINRKSGGFIVAPSHAMDVEWGYVFNNCTITAPGVPSETSVWLGRPWHNFPKTVFLNTRAEVTIPAAGWYETMGGLPVLWADWNTTDADGNPVDLSQRRDTYYYTDAAGNKVYGTAKNFLTDEEAAQYTTRNVLTGSDNWEPVIKTEECDAPVANLKDGVITWEAVPYAICYLVTNGDQVVGFTTETSMDYSQQSFIIKAEAEESNLCIQAVNEFGGLSAKAKVGDGSESGISDINAADGVIEGYYDLQGIRHAQPVKGFNIVVKVDANGNRSTEKVIVK